MITSQQETKEPRRDYIWGLSPLGFHKVAYVEWGKKTHGPVLICAHGLTRNSRDFDYLCKAIKHNYQIVCPDLVGRGESDYTGSNLTYNFAQYLADMVTLLARIDSQEVHWLGTSLGGIIGMMLAAQPNSPIKSLILNDVGMIIPSIALQRLGTYARNDDSFATFEDAKNYFKTALSGFNIIDSKIWDHITKYGTKQDEKGGLSLTYDAVIGEIFRNEETPSLHFETYWQSIRCPVLILRGEASDMLLPEIIKKMMYFRPNTKVITIPQCGHAPSLMTIEQIQIIENWLHSQSTPFQKLTQIAHTL
ncbi:MAG: alpha/beta hydrolase [Alphaproteobacteria bacterium]|nr:alpha/beta hydrolase [Alphaproteobacteria bacterium]